MKKNVFMMGGILSLVLFALLMLLPATPPLSRQYVVLKTEGKSTAGVEKFQKNWMLSDPVFYVKIALLIGGIFLTVKGFNKH